MAERKNLLDAKNEWFENDLTVCILSIYDDEVWALPQIEVERGLTYLEKLQNCRTNKEAQDLYEKSLIDNGAPRFLPVLVDLKSQTDLLDAVYEESIGKSDWTESWASADEYPPSEVTWNAILNEEFNYEESIFYKDGETGVVVVYGRPQLWTDSWIPVEIAEKIGVVDQGYGIDYVPAEFLYKNQNEFISAFEANGFSVLENDARLRKLAGYKRNSSTW